MIYSVNYFNCNEDCCPIQAKFTDFQFYPLHTYILSDLSKKKKKKQKSYYPKAQKGEIQAIIRVLAKVLRKSLATLS